MNINIAISRVCRRRSRGLLLALLIVLPLVAGCFSPPRRLSETAGAVGAAVPADDWKWSGDLDPRTALGPGRRVVVTEFTVDFVTAQLQTPTSRQLLFKPPLAPVGWAIAKGADEIGGGGMYAPMADGQQRALAGELYNAFLQELRRRGLEPVSEDELRASPTYSGPRETGGTDAPGMLLNPLGNDTGMVMSARTVPAPGLGALRRGPLDPTSVDARILQETRADVAVAVRLRVGAFLDQPALERQSEIRLTTREGSTTLRARRSLVSDRDPIEPPRFRVPFGRIEPVNLAGRSSELTAMLPQFLDSALAGPTP